MKGGYTGKILRVNLTEKSVSTIPTEKYADDFGGGHGIGSAVFFDLEATGFSANQKIRGEE